LPERLLPAHVVVAAEMLAVLHLVAHIGRQVGLHEGAHLGCEFLFLGGESEIHGPLPKTACYWPASLAAERVGTTGLRLEPPRRGTGFRNLTLTSRTPGRRPPVRPTCPCCVSFSS